MTTNSIRKHITTRILKALHIKVRQSLQITEPLRLMLQAEKDRVKSLSATVKPDERFELVRNYNTLLLFLGQYKDSGLPIK